MAEKQIPQSLFADDGPVISAGKGKTPAHPSATLSLLQPEWSKVWGHDIRRFNKPELEQALRPLKKLLLQADISFSEDSDPAITALCRNLRNSGPLGMKKEEISTLLISFAQDLENIRNLAAAVAPEFIDIWKRLVTEEHVTCDEIRTALGRMPYTGTGTGWSTSIISEAMLLPAVASMPDKSYYMWTSRFEPKESIWFLPQMTRSAAAPVFLGEEAVETRYVSEIPADDSKLTIENYEAHIPADLRFLTALDSASPLCGSSDSVPQSRLNALEKKMNTPEFPEYDSGIIPSRRKLIGAAFIMALLSNRSWREEINAADARDFAKFTLHTLASDLAGSSFQTFLPAYKGFNKSWTSDSRAPLIAKLVVSLIRPGAETGWLDMANFTLRYRCSDDLVSVASAYTGLFPPDSLRKHTLRKESAAQYDTLRTSDIDQWSDIVLPFIAGYLRLLCATGIIELAVDTRMARQEPLQGIRYLRFTPLGRYALGLDRSYTQATVENEDDAVDIDDDNMIVTLLGENSPYEPFLAKIGHKIGGRRFRITAQSIIRGSKNADEALLNISNFRKTICPEPQGVWKAMLDEATLRTDCHIHDTTQYVLVELNASIPGLIEFITGNSEISQHCFKAEGARLIVPDDFYNRLKDLCRAAGYML